MENSPVVDKCSVCGQPVLETGDDTCTACSEVMLHWLQWSEDFHVPLSRGLSRGMPQWVLDKWGVEIPW